jgi:hypothetical protein
MAKTRTGVGRVGRLSVRLRGQFRRFSALFRIRSVPICHFRQNAARNLDLIIETWRFGSGATNSDFDGALFVNQ